MNTCIPLSKEDAQAVVDVLLSFNFSVVLIGLVIGFFLGKFLGERNYFRLEPETINGFHLDNRGDTNG